LRTGPLSTWRVGLWVLLAYLATILAVTWPVAFKLSSGVLSDPVVDTYCHMWDMWWTWWSVFLGKSSFTASTLLHYPPGVKTTNFLAGPLLFFTAGLIRLFVSNPKATYNLVVLFSILCSCVGGYVAGRRFLESRRAAFLVGAVVAFNPMVMMQVRLGIVEFINLGWAMLFLGSLVRLRRQMDLRSALLSGLWFCVAAAWAWYFGPLLVLLGGGYLLYTLDYRRLLTGRVRTIAPFALWGAILCTMVVVSLRVTSATSIGPRLQQAETRLVSDLRGQSINLRTPGHNEVMEKGRQGKWHPFEALASLEVKLDSSLDPVLGFTSWDRHQGNSFYFIPRWLAPVALALLALLLARSRLIGLCAGLIALCTLVALGPCVIFAGKVHFGTYGWTPYGLLARLVPGIGRMQFPNRTLLLASFALALMAGRGLQVLLERRRWGGWKGIVVTAVCVLLTVVGGASLFEHPMGLTPMQIPRFYQKLAQTPGDIGVINIPFVLGKNVTRGSTLARSAYYQTLHHKRDFSGPVPEAFRGAQRPAPIIFNNLVTRIADITDGAIRPLLLGSLERWMMRRDLLALHQYGFRYIVLHELDMDIGSKSAILKLLEQLLSKPVREINKANALEPPDPICIFSILPKLL
jgi:hypothetical protein